MQKVMIFINLFILIMVLLSVAFFTLLERKLLGYIQFRKGPNKISLNGILQPFSDGMKLFLKNSVEGFNFNKFLFQMFPLGGLFLMFLFWLIFVNMKMEFIFYSILYFMLISSLGVYSVLGSGWSSNSKYALLGAYRSVAQVISYEVGMVFIILSLIFFMKSFNLKSFNEIFGNMNMIVGGFFYLFLIWFIVILAELNRSPFDFSESESELVSGFNIEYGGMKFAFLFLAEYGNMLVMCYFSSFMFFQSGSLSFLLCVLAMIWVRGTYPRFRYDNLMFMNWKIFLPIVLYVFMVMYYFQYYK